jgi:cytochrome c nitrite reductase small subunit
METGEKVIIALVVVVTIVVLGGVAVVMPMMMEEMHKPESCAKNCHEMQPFYDSLKKSPHAEVDCHDCHKPHKPEIFLYIGEGLHHAEWMAEGKSFEEMAEEVENKPPASPKNEYCMECHSEQKIPTEKISDPTISCFKCHPTIEHTTHRVGEYRAYESPDYSGYECAACHNDHDIEVKEETCNICHPPEKHP